MRRRRPEPEPEPPWALLSLLLRYPDERLAAARDEASAEVAALPTGPVRAALERFLAGWTADPAHYVETFDLRRRASLHLTYYAHGDTRERGMALLRLSLHDLGTPYAHLLDAVAELLPPLTVSERSQVARLAREGPPEEAVGLEPYGPPEAMPAGARP